MHRELGRLGVLAGYLGFEIRKLPRTYGAHLRQQQLPGCILQYMGKLGAEVRHYIASALRLALHAR